MILNPENEGVTEERINFMCFVGLSWDPLRKRKKVHEDGEQVVHH